MTTGSRSAASAESRRPRGPVRRGIRARPADVIDVFVYVVVLNLAIEYTPSVISESFTLSLLTAALLKIALEVVVLLKSAILTWLRAAETRRATLAAAVSLWVVAAGSKLVVLELVDLVFGDAVSLGGFIPVTLLVVAPSRHGPQYGASSMTEHLRVQIHIVDVRLHQTSMAGAALLLSQRTRVARAER